MDKLKSLLHKCLESARQFPVELLLGVTFFVLYVVYFQLPKDSNQSVADVLVFFFPLFVLTYVCHLWSTESKCQWMKIIYWLSYLVYIPLLFMVEAAKICEEAGPDILDINFGCPVKRVAGKGAGAGLLRNIPLMLEITRAVVDAVHIPVTVKTRLGWDCNNLIIEELAEQLQDCGIAALTIHGRTRSQMYTGEADWTLIGKVKNNPRIHIPIIGNGDVTSAEICKEKFEQYDVDGVMIGRASIGRP